MFEEILPVILALGNDHLKAKHWKGIFEQMEPAAPSYSGKHFTVK